MSATKRHLETLTDKHRLYAIADKNERAYYRYALLDCAARLLSRCEGASYEEHITIMECVDLVHEFYDELKAVDQWAQ